MSVVYEQTGVETENALDRFVREARELFAVEADPERRWEALGPILGRLLADPAAVEASKGWPDCVPAEGRAENLIFYEDPDFGFTVNGLVKGEARRAANGGHRGGIHDHAHIYTLYGVLDGEERIEGYRRIDDRSRPDHAEIEQTYDLAVGPGELSLVRPFEVHRELLVSERSVAVIIRSERQGTFNQGRYDPETNRYWEGLGPRLTPCDFRAAEAR